MKRLKAYILLALILLTVIQGIGCSQLFRRPRQENQQQGQQQQKKDPPESLVSMEEQTNSIIEEIQKIREQRQKMEQQKAQGIDQAQGGGQNQQGGQKGEQQGQDGQQGGQQEKGGQGGQQQGKGGQQGGQQKKPEINWSGFESKLQTLHSQWNSFEPRAKKDGAGSRLMSDFELQLDALTQQITARNESETLLAANKLYQYFPKFLNLYKHNAPPECKEVKYYVQQVIVYGQDDNWEDTEQLIPSIQDAWERAKGKMEKPDKNLNEKIDYAIDDFIRVVQQKNLALAKLKADILLKNLEQVK
ncbi:MAG: hypothetical protein ACOYEJ_03250 [Mahellales bacterium]|jgi:hypothetical protein